MIAFIGTYRRRFLYLILFTCISFPGESQIQSPPVPHDTTTLHVNENTSASNISKLSGGLLMKAILNNQCSIAQNIIQQGADVNFTDEDGDTPLMFAAMFSSADCMKWLLQHKADPNAKNNLGETALMWCTHDPEKVKLICSWGADLNILSNYGNNALLIACKGAGQTPICEWMISQGADYRIVNKSAETALIRAAQFGDTILVRMLMNKNLDILATDDQGAGALQYAVVNQNWDCVRFLLHNMPDNVKSDTMIAFALGFAVVYDNPEIIYEFTQKIKNIDLADKEGYTALMWAAYSEHVHPEMILTLLNKHPDINHKGKDGQTAITLALQKGNTPIVQMLTQAQRKSL